MSLLLITGSTLLCATALAASRIDRFLAKASPNLAHLGPQVLQGLV